MCCMNVWNLSYMYLDTLLEDLPANRRVPPRASSTVLHPFHAHFFPRKKIIAYSSAWEPNEIGTFKYVKPSSYSSWKIAQFIYLTLQLSPFKPSNSILILGIAPFLWFRFSSLSLIIYKVCSAFAFSLQTMSKELMEVDRSDTWMWLVAHKGTWRQSGKRKRKNIPFYFRWNLWQVMNKEL